MAYSSVVENCSKQIQDALELFSGPPFEGPLVAGREDLKSIFLKVRGDSGKVGVMFSSTPSTMPSADEAEGMLGELTCGSVSALTCLYHFGCGGGEILRQSLRKQAGQFAEAAIELCRSIESGAKAGESVKHAVGRVWSICDGAAKTPLDNKTALFGATAAFLVSSKDVLREMDELAAENAESEAIEKQEGSPNGKSDADDDEEEEEEGSTGKGNVKADDDDSDGLEYQLETDAMSAAEVAALTASRELLDVAVAVVKAASRQLLQGAAVAPGKELDAWEAAIGQCRRLQSAAEDLGAVLYSPQDRLEVETAGDLVFKCTSALLAEVPDSVSTAIGSEDLEKRLEGAASKFREAAARVE